MDKVGQLLKGPLVQFSFNIFLLCVSVQQSDEEENEKKKIG